MFIRMYVFNIIYVDINICLYAVAYLSKGVQQIQLRTEDRENGDLGAVAP
jgi:hypothetical protein